MNPSRRQLLKAASAALALIPIVAHAAKNESVRKSMQYKDSPEGDKKCATCTLFVPGADAAAAGGCKVFPNDTEISPNGYCMAWAKKP